MRFLYLTDSHFFDKAPPSRTDDYLETCLRKLKRVFEIAIEHRISKIVHGGDFFGTQVHARHLTWSAWSKIAAWIATYPDIQWYVNVGQHDMSAHQHESVQSMPLGCLEALPNFRILPHDVPWLLSASNPRVVIIGRWYDLHRASDPNFYTIDIEQRLRATENPYHDFLILTTHGPLGETAAFDKFVALDSLWPSEADLFLGSDYHPGFKPREIAGPRKPTLYLAPGSLMRVEKPASRRVPGVVMIDIEEKIGYKFIPIVEAEDFPFREDAPAVTEESNLPKIEEPEQGVIAKIAAETSAMQFANPYEYVTQVAEETGVSDEVRKQALLYIEQAQKQLESRG
jgi:DNA repair exonuclease SbcCD nuclease subunit